MKTTLIILVTFFLISSDLFCQKINWRLDLFNFLDNTEFAGSSVAIPQTMAGISVAPEIGLVWDTIHKVNLGVNLLHEYGSLNAVDRLYPTAYYEFYNGDLRFIMGAFPRSRVIDNYPRLFFRDSISYYRPNINGIFWEYRKGQNYFNAWLDWTGRQSKTVNEAFFFGLSGRYNREIFYLQNYSYMYHYAEKMDPVVEESIHDNGMFLTSVGIDLSGRTFFRKLEADAGWVLGLERSRLDNTGWITLNGLLIQTRLEYKWFGMFNSFYAGDGLMYYYKDFGSTLYWGDPVYRVKIHNRSDFYVNLLISQKVNIEATFSFHFMESHVYNEQMLKIIVSLNSLKN